MLVADDDGLLREMIREAAELAGAETESARDGADAVEKLAACPFDILVSDLNMPRMDGLELLRHVRAAYPHLLSIIVTGFGSLETAVEAIRLGAYDYIQKPFKLEELGVTIRNAIEKVRIQKENAALIDQMAKLHNRLLSIAGKRAPEHEVYDTSGRLIAGPLYSDYYTQSYALLETPDGSPNRTLTALDVLKGLCREGAISAPELDRLKAMILGRIDPEAP